MKPSGFILTALTILTAPGCATNHKSTMLMDSSFTKEKDVIVVHTNVPVRIMESMKNFEDNPNITRADIDAGTRIESAEVKYVNKGDKIKISEEAPPTNK